MLPNSCLPAVMDVYPQQPEYVQQPTGEDQLNGVKPLDTLPAQWWNWLWKNITTNEAKTAVFMTNLSNEFVNLLAAAGLTPDNTDVQLRNAVRGMIETVATTAALGTVKSSTASGKVGVDNEGVMTPNGLGTPSSLQTTATDVVSAINEVHNAIGDLDTLSTSQKTDIVAALNSFISLGGTANGYATLDSSGRLPASQLPESSLEYQGTWDASTNTPTLADGTGTKGDFYIVSVGGLWNSIAFSAGDRILYDGSTWQRLSGGDVQTVNSKSADGSGNILLQGCDIQLGLGTCSTETLACALVCNGAGTLLGALTSLCTTCKDTLVNAINCLYFLNEGTKHLYNVSGCQNSCAPSLFINSYAYGSTTARHSLTYRTTCTGSYICMDLCSNCPPAIALGIDCTSVACRAAISLSAAGDIWSKKKCISIGYEPECPISCVCTTDVRIGRSHLFHQLAIGGPFPPMQAICCNYTTNCGGVGIYAASPRTWTEAACFFRSLITLLHRNSMCFSCLDAYLTRIPMIGFYQCGTGGTYCYIHELSVVANATWWKCYCCATNVADVYLCTGPTRYCTNCSILLGTVFAPTAACFPVAACIFNAPTGFCAMTATAFINLPTVHCS